MSTVIHFECHSATHLATRSRGGVGGMVIHHGTFGYCDGFASDNDHHWVPTGGVFLEQLIRDDNDRSNNARYVAHVIGTAGPLHIAR